MTLEMRGICKSFGSNDVLKHVDFSIQGGEICALLGENGAGKSTLMNILGGVLPADRGEIVIDGTPVHFRTPSDSLSAGVAFIHQELSLINDLAIYENMFIGRELKTKYGLLDAKTMIQKTQEVFDRLELHLDPRTMVRELDASYKQIVEISRAMMMEASLIIMDEPTTSLTDPEIERVFDMMRMLQKQNVAIVFISHKLNEIMAVADRVTVLRKGKYIGTVHTADTDPQKLTEMMVGRAVSLNIDRPEAKYRDLRLEVKGLTCRDHEGIKTLDDVSFQAFGGEILGIAGIAGSGQKELLEAIAGLQAAEAGSVLYYPPHPNSDIAGYHVPVDRDGEELVGKTPMQIRRVGVSLAFVPEDRLGMGLVAGMDMVDNMMLKTYREHKGPFVDRKAPRALAQRLIDELEIVTPGVGTPVRRLSGGNVQKVLVGREIDSTPTVLMTAYPVRGLDINSSYTIYGLLNQQKMKGVAVLLVGEDLDVLLELCDRILVLCGGKVSGIVDGRNTTKEEVGLYMTHVGGGKEAGERA